LQKVTEQRITEPELLKRFIAEVKTKVPHLREEVSGPVIVNATPLVDITSLIIECARAEYGLEISANTAMVFGKFDSEIFGGSVKVRPAVQIIEEAIASGQLGNGKTVFEATSGNFGIALGMLRSLGLDVIALVSRKLQSGVLDQLTKVGVKLVNLDIDICPAPGLQVDTNILVAKGIAGNLRDQLAKLALDVRAFDSSRAEIEQSLERQDVINLAKLFAKIYGGFCPEQYDNDLNVGVHETITGPEIDQQLRALGHSLAEFKVICTFGTGGTSTGISKYVKTKHDRRTVHTVFPLANQEVGGIRTREKALGLKFYRSELYAGQHEVDFEAARRVLRFFASKGYNIGESSALALYACIQMLNFCVGDKFVVIVADGIQKYRKSLETRVEGTKRYEVTFGEARSSLSDYGEVLWTHTMFVPKDEGIKLISSALGCDQNLVKIARARDVEAVISNQEMPETMRRLLPKPKRKLLLVCMVGSTSLRVAQLLAKAGIEAESLTGGIMGVPEAGGRHPSEIVQVAIE
jgi:cysteine synthase/rhodanese-related sulfurtransferase